MFVLQHKNNMGLAIFKFEDHFYTVYNLYSWINDTNVRRTKMTFQFYQV